MSAYWFISAPADPTKIDTVNKLQEKIASKQADMAEVFQANLPDCKVPRLDLIPLGRHTRQSLRLVGWARQGGSNRRGGRCEAGRYSQGPVERGLASLEE